MIYFATKTFPLEEKYITVKHMKECSRNIPGNVAEAFGRFHYQESLHFYRIARGSLLELKSDIYCSLDSGFVNNEIFNNLINQCEKVIALINGLIKSTTNTQKIQK